MKLSNWEYGGIYKNYDMIGEIYIGTGIVKVHDIFDPLPDFMLQADCLFIDPPWNLGNLNSFYTKADRIDYQKSFEAFYIRLFQCIGEIRPRNLYVEIGKQYLADFIIETRKIFKNVTFYNSNYYHKKDNKCYIVYGTNKRIQKSNLDYMDEEDIIKWICINEDYECIGDLCMGRGLVGIHAYKVGKPFVGTELNPKRLAVLIERISELGGNYENSRI